MQTVTENECSLCEQNEREQRTPKANARKRRKEALHREIQKVQENTELSEKQRLFCLYYVRYFNATKAYMKAYGCDAKTAGANGYRLLKKAEIRKEIESLKQSRMNRELLSEGSRTQAENGECPAVLVQNFSVNVVDS